MLFRALLNKKFLQSLQKRKQLQLQARTCLLMLKANIRTIDILE